MSWFVSPVFPTPWKFAGTGAHCAGASFDCDRKGKGDEKESHEALKRLSAKEKLSIRRLIFKSNRQNYYDPYAIDMYIKGLPNLEYFEIQTKSEEIICLIPKSTFLDHTVPPPNFDTDLDNIGKFVQAIENDDVPRALRSS